MFLRSIGKLLLPPLLLKGVRALIRKPGTVSWQGNYTSWETAASHCTAYDTEDIFLKVINSTRKVVKGEAAFERDSYVSDEIEYSWPLLASLLQVYCETGGLRVADFGGSLGSTFRQNHRFFDRLPNVCWNVVEQTHFVEAGQREFETDRLRFFHSIADVESPSVVLFASSLCYLHDPWFFISQADKTEAKFMLIDRTPFIEGSVDRICVQTVRPPIYSASYPCRYFSRTAFIDNMLQRGWRVIESWHCAIQADSSCQYLGYLLTRS